MDLKGVDSEYVGWIHLPEYIPVSGFVNTIINLKGS
jgi:hypothetical protein